MFSFFSYFQKIIRKKTPMDVDVNRSVTVYVNVISVCLSACDHNYLQDGTEKVNNLKEKEMKMINRKSVKP